MKYILTSGCSFTNNTRYRPNNKLASENYPNEDYKSWPYYLQKEVGEDYEVWNLGGKCLLQISVTHEV